MVDTKISDLGNITGANLADVDEFVVVDTSASETKAVTLGELRVAVKLSFDTFSTFINDTRTFPVGTTLEIPAIGAVYQATAGTGNLGQTNAGEQEFDVLSPIALAWRPSADGMADDSVIFKRIEASAFKEIDLGGKSYALVSFWVDPTNGVKLTKNYKNGTLLVDGRKLVMDRDLGISASAAAASSLPRTSAQKSLGLFKNDDNNFDVWTNKVGQVWTKQSLSRTTTGIPFNLNRGVFTTVLAYKAAREDGVVYTGGWATDNATTAISSAGDTYISGRAQQSITAGDYVEITFNGGGDIYVIFTGRTTGNFVNVLLEGTQNYLTLPDDGGGNSYFDSYTSADLQHRQSVQIASGVPSGTHTIRLTVSASKNASSAGDRFVFNALGWSSADVGPWTPEADAPAWVTGEAVLLNQRRKSGQNYYRATADGTTGATAPTHTSGSVSDGGVTWAYTATSSYESPEHLFQAPGSQLEYAYEIKPTGAASFEDVGGALHGNEAQTAVQWYLSGSKVTPPDNSWLVGDNLEIREDLEVTHSEIGGGATVIDTTQLRRRFVRDGFEVSYPRSMDADGVFGYDYPHMWPLLHYEASGFRKTVLDVWTPSDGHRDPADWYGITNPFVGRTKDTLMVASGNCLQPAGAAGVPSAVPAPYRFVAWLDISPESVDYYRATGSIYAAKAMNLSGGNFASGGFSSGSVKMYFERSATTTPEPFSDGDVIECRAFYGITVMGG